MSQWRIGLLFCLALGIAVMAQAQSRVQFGVTFGTPQVYAAPQLYCTPLGCYYAYPQYYGGYTNPYYGGITPYGSGLTVVIPGGRQPYPYQQYPRVRRGGWGWRGR